MPLRKRWTVGLGGALFVLLAAAVLMVVPSGTAAAAVPGGIGYVPTTVRLSPASGPAGSVVSVRGTGFDPGICLGSAGIRWRGAGFTAVTHVPLNPDGTFSTSVRVPSAGWFGGPSARLVTSCGPGLIGLPGPRAWFTLVAAAPAKPAPAKPAPAKPAPAKPAPAKPAPAKPAEPSTGSGGGSGSGAGSGSGTGSGSGSGSGSGTGSGAGSGGGSTGGDGPESLDGTFGTGSGTASGAGSADSPGSTDPTEIAVPPAPSPGPAAASPGPAASSSAGPSASPSGGVLAVGRPSLPTSSGTGAIRPALITATVPTAAEAVLNAKLVLLAIALAALFIVLVAFPADLFNNTYAANATEIRTLLAYPVRRLRRAAVDAGATAQQAKDGVRNAGFGFLVFVGASTLLTVILAGNESDGGNWPAQVLGLLIAIAVVTLVAKLPAEFAARRYSGGIEGRFHVLPASILVAVVTTLISRLLKLEPAYMYGLFAGFATAVERPLSRRQEGHVVLAGLGSAATFGVACWLLWSPVHSAAYAGDPSWGGVLLDTTLFWCFALATSGLVFSLIPLSFMDGAVLRDWHPMAWFVPQVAAAAFFFYVFLLHGGSGDVSSATLWRALVFFAVFGLASLAFWAYFRWEGRPSHAVVSDLNRTTTP